MKKTLSFVLVAAMLLCMIPAFGIFAAEADLSTIDNADELIALAEAANAGGGDYRRGETIKVTADIDMTGKSLTPFKSMIFTLDFDGHTLSNLHRTVENGSGNIGLLADFATNNGVNGLITNLKLKDCSLTVTGSNSCNVGLVGDANRANITNVTVDGLTITHEGSGNVGTLMGIKRWGYNSDIVATLKNVTIDAPYANVGVVIGSITDSDSFNLTSLDASVTVKRSLNDIANDTYTASGADKLNVTADAVSATVTDQQDGKRTNYTAIGSADDLMALAEAYNKFGKNFLGSQEIKITADIDMTGKTWTPIKEASFTLNGQNHTISGLVVTVDSTAQGDYGLLVNTLANDPGNGRIKDLTIKNSSITVTSTAAELSAKYAGNKGVNVGAVVGRTDRGSVNNVSLENVTVKVNGLAYVGSLVGFREWQVGDDHISGTYKNVLLDAPDAVVGSVIGFACFTEANNGSTISNLTVDVAVSEGTEITKSEASEVVAVTEEGYNTVNGDNINVTISAATEDSGYVPPKVEPEQPEQPEQPVKPAPTGDFMIVAVMVSIIALAGVAIASKKRSAC